MGREPISISLTIGEKTLSMPLDTTYVPGQVDDLKRMAGIDATLELLACLADAIEKEIKSKQVVRRLVAKYYTD